MVTKVECFLLMNQIPNQFENSSENTPNFQKISKFLIIFSNFVLILVWLFFWLFVVWKSRKSYTLLLIICIYFEAFIFAFSSTLSCYKVIQIAHLVLISFSFLQKLFIMFLWNPVSSAFIRRSARIKKNEYCKAQGLWVGLKQKSKKRTDSLFRGIWWFIWKLETQGRRFSSAGLEQK